MTKKVKYLFLLLPLFIMACSNPCDNLDAKIYKHLRSGNEVTSDELSEIESFIRDYELDITDCNGSLFEGEELSPSSIRAHIIKLSKKLPNSENIKVWEPLAEEIEDSKPITLNVYIENSGSMDGYVKGVTDFESAIYNLLVDLNQTVTPSINLFYINSKQIPFPNEISSFIKKLEPETFKQRGGDRGNTDLNSIFKSVLTDIGPNDLSILISDGIYSVAAANATESLNNQSAGLKEAFSDKINESPDLAVLNLKLKSNFTGYYYDFNDIGHYYNEERPYFLWLIGSYQNIAQVLKHPSINLDKVEGFQNSYFINSQGGQAIKFTLLSATENIGTFRLGRGDLQAEKVMINPKASDRRDNNGVFQFAIAIDLNEIIGNDGLIKNSENYDVSEPFEVVKVDEISNTDIHQSDMRLIEGWATHIITLRCNNCPNLNGIDEIEVSLNRKLPRWIKETTILEDQDINQIENKTFGFSYMIEGIDNAFRLKYPETSTLFKFKIDLTNE